MVFFSPMPARRRKVIADARAKAGAQNLLDPLDLKYKLVLRDHDVLGHFTNIRYNQLAELAREAWFISVGLEDSLQDFSVSIEDMTFIKMMRSGMNFTMRTRLETWNDTTLIFSHTSETPKRQTGAGLCALRLSEGAMTVPDLLATRGLTAPPPNADPKFAAYLA